MDKEIETPSSEDFKSEILRVLQEHKRLVSSGAIAAGFLTIAIGGYALGKLLIEKRKNLKPELEEIIEELGEMLAQQPEREFKQQGHFDLSAMALIDEMGQSIEASGDLQAANILQRITKALGFQPGYSPRDEALVASAAVTRFIKVLFNPEEKE